MAFLGFMDQDRLARPDDGFERILEALCVRCPVLVEDDQVHVEQLQAPVLVRPEQLPDDVEILGLVDPNQDDREVARDAVGPQTGSATIVQSQEPGRWPKRGIRVDDPVRQGV